MVTYWYKLIYVGMRAGTWICTSEYYTLIQLELRRWISQKKMEKGLSAEDIGRLNLIQGEIENDPVGISCRYFTVNYRLLGSVRL